MTLITKSNPKIDSHWTFFKTKLLSSSGLVACQRNEWIDSGRFKQGMFGQKALISYMGGGFDDTHPMTEHGIHVYAHVWQLEIPLLAHNQDLNANLRDAVGGVFDTLKELEKGDSSSKIVGCDVVNSFTHTVDEQEPLDDRVMQDWVILTFPQITIFSEGMI